MVRLVFRPYTQIRRSICTSEPLRASTRVSPGFTLFRHSSPSFGSQHVCSNSNLSPKIMIGRWCLPQKKDSHLSLPNKHLLSFRARVLHSNTCTYVRLLGPCFKTGRLQPFRTHRHTTDPEGRKAWYCSSIQFTAFVKSIQLPKEPTFLITHLPKTILMCTCSNAQTYIHKHMKNASEQH